MRRKDRKMDEEFGLDLIDRSSYGNLSMVDENNEAYGIPLSIVRENKTLYFHSAKAGRKVDIFRGEPMVSISFVGVGKIPENYSKEELDEIVKDKSKAVVLISSVFTTEFESAIVRGRIRLVKDREEKIKAMKLICEKYTPDKMDYFPTAIEAGLNRANVYGLKIEEISAKRKKYDSEGKEMKWARMV